MKARSITAVTVLLALAIGSGLAVDYRTEVLLQSDLQHFLSNEAPDITFSLLSGFCLEETETLDFWSQSHRIRTIEPLRRLKSIKRLNLPFSMVSDFEPLVSLPGLEELDINHLARKDIDFPRILAIKKLNLDGVYLRNLPDVASLRNLDELILNSKRINTIESLASLNQLETLNIRGTSVEDIGPTLRLTRLKSLTLPPTVSDFSALTSRDSLCELAIYCSTVDQFGPITTLRSLTSLTISAPSDFPLDCLRGLSKLKRVRIKGTDGNLNSLRLLTDLEDLHIETSTITNIDGICNNTHLKRVHLEGTTDESLDYLSSLLSLELLFIRTDAVIERETLASLSALYSETNPSRRVTIISPK